MTNGLSETWIRDVSIPLLESMLRVLARSVHPIAAPILDDLAQAAIPDRAEHPMARSTLYRHRDVLIRLGLVNRRARGYSLSESCQLIQSDNSSTSIRHAIASAMMRSDDCWERFLRLFVEPGTRCYSWGEFLEHGDRVRWAVVGKKSRLSGPGGEIIVETKAEKRVVLYGLRSWALGLPIIDEYSISDRESILFPVDALGQRAHLMQAQLSACIIRNLDFESGWASAAIQDLINCCCVSQKTPKEILYGVLKELIRAHPDLIAPVYTSPAMATLWSGSASRREFTLKSYLLEPGMRYVSHIRFHQALVELLGNKERS